MRTRAPLIRPLNPVALGRSGQSYFMTLCDKGKLIATDSTRADYMGWDVHVEVPLGIERDEEPFDKRHKVPDMKVQVKTIWADNNSVDLSLIAAERLARWEYPSFVIILRMEMDKSFRDMFVIHLFDENLARILRALRKAEASEGLSLKSKTLTFSTNIGTNIPLNGDILARTLRDALGNDGRGYAVRKRNQLDNLGYGVHRVLGEFDLIAENIDEALSVMVGLRHGEAKNIKVDDIRFDIPIPVDRNMTGRIGVNSASKNFCRLVLSSYSRYKRSVFDAELYFASFGADGPWKIRATSDIIELIASSTDAKVSLRTRIRESGLYTIGEFIQMTQFSLVIALGRMSIAIQKQGRTFLKFDVPQQTSFNTPEYLEARFKRLTGLRKLMDEVGLRDLRLSEEDIANNTDGIEFVLAAQRSENDIEFTFRVPLFENCPDTSEFKEALFASKINFIGATIGFWAHAELNAHRNDKDLTLKSKHFVLRDIAKVDDDAGFTSWVKAASEATGLDFVISTEAIYFDTESPPDEATAIGAPL